MFGALALENGYGALALENRGRKKGRGRGKGRGRSTRSRSRGGYKFGDFIRQSRARGAKLLTVSRHGGRPVYKVKGLPGKYFFKFGHAITAANSLAYGRRR